MVEKPLATDVGEALVVAVLDYGDALAVVETCWLLPEGAGVDGLVLQVVGTTGTASLVAPGTDLRVVGPGPRQVDLPVDQRVPRRRRVAEKHTYLGILDPAGGAGVLALDTDTVDTLLEVAGVVDDQHPVRVAELVGHVATHIVAYRIGVPDRFTQQPLHPVRGLVPGVLDPGETYLVGDDDFTGAGSSLPNAFFPAGKVLLQVDGGALVLDGTNPGMVVAETAWGDDPVSCASTVADVSPTDGQTANHPAALNDPWFHANPSPLRGDPAS